MITFLWPLSFLLLPLPLLVRWKLKPATLSETEALRVPFFRVFAGQQGSGSTSNISSIWRFILALLIWTLLVTALARPVRLGQEVPLPAVGRNLMMAIDLSGSMQEEDLALGGRKATRLAVVKEAADDFISRRKGDRVGLVLFSDRAYLQSPLTFDREVVRQLLNQAQVGLTGQKTAIGDAIAISSKRLKDRPNGSRVLILLTDGVNNEGVMNPIKAAELAKKLGIRIYTIGVGAKSLAVNTPFGPQMVNPSQDLDEDTLRKIASITGGKYFRATDVKGLSTIYHDIDQLEPVSGDPIYVRPKIALYFWPAGLALILSGLFALLMIIPNINLSVTKQVEHN